MCLNCGHSLKAVTIICSCVKIRVDHCPVCGRVGKSCDFVEESYPRDYLERVVGELHQKNEVEISEYRKVAIDFIERMLDLNPADGHEMTMAEKRSIFEERRDLKKMMGDEYYT